MEQEFIYNSVGIRPQELESRPLSGKTVTVRSHSGSGIGFRGREYKPNCDGLIRRLPIEAVQQIEGATYWFNGKPSTMKFDIVEE